MLVELILDWTAVPYTATSELSCSGPDDNAPGLGPDSLVDLTSIIKLNRFSKPWSQTFISSTIAPIALPSWFTVLLQVGLLIAVILLICLMYKTNYMIGSIVFSSRQHRPNDSRILCRHRYAGLVKAAPCDQLGDPLIDTPRPLGGVH